MLILERECCTSIAKLGGKTDKFYLGSSLGETADYANKHGDPEWKSRINSNYSGGFMGKDNFPELVRKLHEGDNDYVGASDSLMTKFEDTHHPRSSWKTVDAISGGMPNVPAYLSGSPMAMRRRTRVQTDQAPLAIVVDVACSAAYKTDQIAAKGSAVLALLRVLAASRPVTLWIGGGFEIGDNRASACWVFSQIETAPLDLARAAYALSSPAIARCITFSMCGAEGSNMQWAYSGAIDSWNYRKHGRELFSGVIPGADDVLYVPPMVLGDDEPAKHPDRWLKRMIEQYGNPEIEE